MNKLIQELLLQSKNRNTEMVDEYKFAELIVLDCVNLLEFHGFDDAVQYVRLHFGIKP